MGEESKATGTKTWDMGSCGLGEGTSRRRSTKAGLGRVEGVLSSITG